MVSKTLCVASSLALVAGLAVPALAQDTAAGEQPSAADTGEAATQADVAEQGRNTTIVVTAEFREENLQDTPIAITAVNAAMLEARGDVDVSDVAATAPNVTLKAQPQNGGSGLIAFIRGVGQTDFNFALDPGVGVYIDDVYIPTLSSSLLQLIDLDRVEILRGPQGTLAGKNSIGGAIKLFSAKPKGDGTGSFHLSYGSFNEIEARGMADVKLTDNVFMRVLGHGARARRLCRYRRLRRDPPGLERARQQCARLRQQWLPDPGRRKHPGRTRGPALPSHRRARNQHCRRLYARAV